MIQRDIFRKMLLVIVSLLLPMLMLLVYSNQTGAQVVEKEIRSSSLHKLSFLLSQVDAQIYQLNANMLTMIGNVDALKYVTRFTEDPYERSILRSELEKKLLLLSITSPWTNRIALYDPQGEAIVSSDGKDTFDKTGTLGGSGSSWGFSGQEDQPSTWAFTRQMMDTRTQSKLGDIQASNLVVETTFSALSLQNVLDQYKSGSSGNPLLWLPGSRVVIGNRQSNLTQMKEVADKLILTEKGNNGSTVLKLNGGEEVLVTHLYLDALNGYLIDYVPLHESLAPIARQRGLFYLISALMLATAALSALLLYRHVTVPIRRLVDGVQQMKLGHFGTRIHDKASSEFEFLYTRFNQMAEQIQRLIENVYEERLRTKDAKLKQLQSQINPHFLYNCFSHIVYMSEMGNNEGVTAMSHNLSDYYRYTTRIDKPTALLSEELTFVINYLEIQKVRLPRLSYKIEVPERLRAFPLPRLLLQPLVENAVIHGIEPSSKPGFISIVGEIKKDRILLHVRDNGGGMRESEIMELSSRVDRAQGDAEGYGLRNVHQRLQLIYGPESGLKFETFSANKGGFQATIDIRTEMDGVEGCT